MPKLHKFHQLFSQSLPTAPRLRAEHTLIDWSRNVNHWRPVTQYRSDWGNLNLGLIHSPCQCNKHPGVKDIWKIPPLICMRYVSREAYYNDAPRHYYLSNGSGGCGKIQLATLRPLAQMILICNIKISLAAHRRLDCLNRFSESFVVSCCWFLPFRFSSKWLWLKIVGTKQTSKLVMVRYV